MRLTAFPIGSISIDGLTLFFGETYIRQSEISFRRGMIVLKGPSHPDVRLWRRIYMRDRKRHMERFLNEVAVAADVSRHAAWAEMSN